MCKHGSAEGEEKGTIGKCVDEVHGGSFEVIGVNGGVLKVDRVCGGDGMFEVVNEVVVMQTNLCVEILWLGLERGVIKMDEEKMYPAGMVTFEPAMDIVTNKTCSEVNDQLAE
jgi:hypothetical protein